MNPTVKPVAPKYGMLTVLRHERGAGWRVRCECGNERHYDGGALRTGTYVSCGCARYSRHRELMQERWKHRLATKNAHLKPTRFPKTGSRCWCCRNKTGEKAPVALCYVCKGEAP